MLQAVMLLCLAVAGYRQRMLNCEGGPLRILGATCGECFGCHQPVECCCCILLPKIYGWAVVILVRLGCWVWVLACNSERIGRCGKSPTIIRFIFWAFVPLIDSAVKSVTGNERESGREKLHQDGFEPVSSMGIKPKCGQGYCLHHSDPYLKEFNIFSWL